MSEQTNICVTLALCYLIHGRKPSKVRACAKRLPVIELANVKFLQELISLDNSDIKVVMNNILK